MVIDGLKQFGYPMSILPYMGTVALLGGLLALIPITEVVGVILLTAYLGAAALTHLRGAGNLVHAGTLRRHTMDRALLERASRTSGLPPQPLEKQVES
jgi:hypothetical protein